MGGVPVRLALALVAAMLVRAEPALAQGDPGSVPAPPAPPALNWTRDPVRIDRSQQTLPRLPDRAAERPPPEPLIIVRMQSFPRVHDSATFEVGGRKFRLDGLDPIPRDRLCTDDKGRRWTCGLRASGALAQRIQRRNFSCRPVGSISGDPLVVDCQIGGRSLSLDIAQDGWAGARDPTGALAEAAKAAQARQLGIHGTSSFLVDAPRP